MKIINTDTVFVLDKHSVVKNV